MPFAIANLVRFTPKPGSNAWAQSGGHELALRVCAGLCANLKILWSSTKLEPSTAGGNAYVAHRDAPSGGRWSAFFVDLTFEPAMAWVATP